LLIVKPSIEYTPSSPVLEEDSPDATRTPDIGFPEPASRIVPVILAIENSREASNEIELSSAKRFGSRVQEALA
jgi:hypothetical protein